MFRAIGFVIALYAVSVMLNDAFESFEKAVTATFKAVETAAVVSERQIINMQN